MVGIFLEEVLSPIKLVLVFRVGFFQGRKSSQFSSQRCKARLIYKPTFCKDPEFDTRLYQAEHSRRIIRSSISSNMRL